MIVADIFQALPEIIKEAAKSPLAFFAYLFAALAIIAFLLFNKARYGTRFGIFLLLFALALFLGAMAYRAGGTPSDLSIITQPGSHTIINITVSKDKVRTQLQETIPPRDELLRERYPLGYVAFGIAQGKVVFQPEPGLEFNPKNKAVIEIDAVQNRATVTLIFLQATFPNGSFVSMERVEHIFDYVENKPVKFGMQFGFGKNGEAINAFIEVLDKSKFIFLLGFKYAE